jgi:hypothetical protein
MKKSFNLATYPPRLGGLRDVINSIYNQADIIRVYLNEYTFIPDFLIDDKIEVAFGLPNIKDTGKFYWADTFRSEYYFTIDDDVIYPKNYADNLIECLERNNVSVATVHGKIMSNKDKLPNTAIKHQLINDQDKDIKVNYLGTGASVFDLRKIVITKDIFKTHGYTDEYLSVALMRLDVPIICARHKQIKIIKYEKNLFSQRDNELAESILNINWEIERVVAPAKINNNILQDKKKIKIGAIYTTFYDIDMLEKSILSIKGAVEYIVVVHQEVGFNGKEQEPENQTILKDLLDRKLINDIVYYEGKDKVSGMIEKNNIGLSYLKNNACNYAMVMAPDMRYSSIGIINDVAEMDKGNIDTLYMPIKAFYYDENHYFIDTYYCQQIHKIDDRKYKLTTSSLLCDPLLKMEERKYKVSNNYILHYTFLKEKYGNKLNNSIRCLNNETIKSQMKQIYDRLQNWKEGKKALVFSNDLENKGKVVLKEVELVKKPLNKIAVLIPFWQRFEITSFVFNHYKSLKEVLKDEMEIILIAVGSEGKKSKEVAIGNGFHYLEYSNDSIQLKHDALYLKAKDFNPDACVKIDSDSIVSIEFFNYWNDLINNGVDYSEVLDIYFLFKNCMCYWGGYTNKRVGEGTGVGRFMSSNLLNKLNWQIIGQEKKGILIDTHMTNRIKPLKINRTKIKCSDINGKIIELKSKCQLTKLDDFSYNDISCFPAELYGIKEQLLYNDKCKYYSVIIPTMWRSDYILQMLKIYENEPLIKEVILINNDISKTPNLNFSKVKEIRNKENIYVNPAWNMGVEMSESKYIAIINDDILIDKDNLHKILERGLQLEANEMIGVNENCYKQKGLDNSGLKFVNSEKMGYGFGCFMIMRKSSFVNIPNDLKIWYGDNFQYRNKAVYEIKGIEILTPMSTTVNKFRNTITKQDVINWKKYSK